MAEQAELEQQTKQINAEARTLQQSTNDVNVKIDKLNGNIATLQTVIKSKPEEGLYESASTQSLYTITTADENWSIQSNTNLVIVLV